MSLLSTLGVEDYGTPPVAVEVPVSRPGLFAGDSLLYGITGDVPEPVDTDKGQPSTNTLPLSSSNASSPFNQVENELPAERKEPQTVALDASLVRCLQYYLDIHEDEPKGTELLVTQLAVYTGWLCASSSTDHLSTNGEFQLAKWALDEGIALMKINTIGFSSSQAASTLPHWNQRQNSFEEMIRTSRLFESAESNIQRKIGARCAILSSQIGWDFEASHRFLTNLPRKLDLMNEKLREMLENVGDLVYQDVVKKAPTSPEDGDARNSAISNAQLFGLQVYRHFSSREKHGFSRQDYDRYTYVLNDSITELELFCLPLGARRRGDLMFTHLEIMVSYKPHQSRCICRQCQLEDDGLDAQAEIEELKERFLDTIKPLFNFKESFSDGFNRICGFITLEDTEIPVDVKFALFHQVGTSLFYWTGPTQFVSRIQSYAKLCHGVDIQHDGVWKGGKKVHIGSERDLFEKFLGTDFPAPHERY
ncbi:hypothetical protein BCR33DRAFT_781301 [Rhizoclosmatium globosum]|uniref:DNA polymerase beta thumb domain-containing protein n=1 Tax=Rhizoclosmatium globosum TaxID=329046 RepID=A0A1Y2CRR7_9FUNG|nr:hypothetical protein BCR33DRAFT_781301 [Rhizoclosmatium globosum]|eukprot:ORY49750.1 hypothetical protein BCR33DRAFT_781301 [Rhizoclosmatium globosum]